MPQTLFWHGVGWGETTQSITPVSLAETETEAEDVGVDPFKDAREMQAMEAMPVLYTVAF